MCVKHSVQHLLNLRVMLNTVHNKDNSFLPYNYLSLGVCLLANSRTIHLLTEAIKPGSPVRLYLLQKALTSNHPVLYILPYKYLTLPSPPPKSALPPRHLLLILSGKFLPVLYASR